MSGFSLRKTHPEQPLCPGNLTALVSLCDTLFDVASVPASLSPPDVLGLFSLGAVVSFLAWRGPLAPSPRPSSQRPWHTGGAEPRGLSQPSCTAPSVSLSPCLCPHGALARRLRARVLHRRVLRISTRGAGQERRRVGNEDEEDGTGTREASSGETSVGRRWSECGPMRGIQRVQK